MSLGKDYARLCRPTESKKAPVAFYFWTMDSLEDNEPTYEKIVITLVYSHRSLAFWIVTIFSSVLSFTEILKRTQTLLTILSRRMQKSRWGTSWTSVRTGIRWIRISCSMSVLELWQTVFYVDKPWNGANFCAMVAQWWQQSALVNRILISLQTAGWRLQRLKGRARWLTSSGATSENICLVLACSFSILRLVIY